MFYTFFFHDHSAQNINKPFQRNYATFEKIKFWWFSRLSKLPKFHVRSKLSKYLNFEIGLFIFGSLYCYYLDKVDCLSSILLWFCQPLSQCFIGTPSETKKKTNKNIKKILWTVHKIQRIACTCTIFHWIFMDFGQF